MKDPYKGRKTLRQTSSPPGGKSPQSTKGAGLGDVKDPYLTGKGSPWAPAHGSIKERRGSTK